MTAQKYAQHQVRKFGVEIAKENINEAIEHHTIQYNYHRHPKCLTTLNFFKNVLQNICLLK